jgi:hypothetical protein
MGIFSFLFGSMAASGEPAPAVAPSSEAAAAPAQSPTDGNFATADWVVRKAFEQTMASVDVPPDRREALFTAYAAAHRSGGPRAEEQAVACHRVRKRHSSAHRPYESKRRRTGLTARRGRPNESRRSWTVRGRSGGNPSPTLPSAAMCPGSAIGRTLKQVRAYDTSESGYLRSLSGKTMAPRYADVLPASCAVPVTCRSSGGSRCRATFALRSAFSR